MDLIKTIGDEEEVPDFSENSDEEEEYQPTKYKRKKEKAINVDFAFAASAVDYNKDTWNDVQKYIRRIAKFKTDDKIKNARLNMKKDEEDSDNEAGADDIVHENKKDEDALSDDELKKDVLRLKESRIKKKKGKKMGLMPKVSDDEEDKEFFEDAPPFDEHTSFYEMSLSRPLMKAIQAMGFVHPTPIQAATIPVALLGRDICGCAATGTGKTAAYMLPTMERLIYKPLTGESVTRVVVLVPTRELGVQVYEVTRQLAQFTKVDAALSVGGLDVKYQEAMLRKSPDIVIATPGRLIDHIKNTMSFTLDRVEVLILDEADRMLDEYFQEQMTEIIKSCARTRQTLLFSATMTDAVKDLAAVSLDRPVRIFVDNNQDVAFNLRQEFVKIRHKYEPYREATLAALVCRTFSSHTMIFVQTKKQAHRIHILLGLLGVKVTELHGNLTQPMRLEALRKFKDCEVDVMVATDVAARGLDIRNVRTVINFIMPATLEHYIHRVGRTARAGRAGVSVSMCGETERKMVKQIIKRARLPVKSRTIPYQILEKYRNKCDKLESEINRILEEEFQERMLAKAENQVIGIENRLKDEREKPREWFQTAKERMKMKERQKLESKNGDGNKKKKKKRGDDDDEPRTKRVKQKKMTKEDGQKDTEEGAMYRVQQEMQKAALLQVRLAKRKKPQKLKAVHESTRVIRHDSGDKADQKKRKKSSFAEDLTDVSKKKVKSLRYDASKQQREDKRAQFRKKPNQNKKQNPGKAKRWK